MIKRRKFDPAFKEMAPRRRTGGIILCQEQKQIRQLQKDLKEALLERDILKKAVIGPPSGIFSKDDGRTAARKSSGL